MAGSEPGAQDGRWHPDKWKFAVTGGAVGHHLVDDSYSAGLDALYGFRTSTD